MSGRELSHRFYSEQVRPRIEPVLGDSPHAAGMLGDGSDVLGFDDDVSPDHDFGPRVQIVIPPDVDPSPVLTALRTLPTRYDGLPVYFTSPSAFNGWTEGVPGLTAAGALFRARLRPGRRDHPRRLADHPDPTVGHDDRRPGVP